MFRLILLFSLLFSFSLGDDFSKSKKTLLKNVYYDHQFTFYCNNPYYIDIEDGKEVTRIYKDDSKYTPYRPLTKKKEINIRTIRVEWEHIMPAENFGRQLDCWKDGGRKNCKSDYTFNQMEADMHNLVPAIGEINGDRSNYRFNWGDPKNLKYGNCPIEIDSKKVYVGQEQKGFIARVYLYMSDKYNIKLSEGQRNLMNSWNIIFPPSDWELIRHNRIYQLTGSYNKYIIHYKDNIKSIIIPED